MAVFLKDDDKLCLLFMPGEMTRSYKPLDQKGRLVVGNFLVRIGGHLKNNILRSGDRREDINGTVLINW